MAESIAGPEIQRLIQLLSRLPGLGPRSARRVALHLLRKREELKNAANADKKKIEWGSQIRSYVFHPYKMIKDHRTDFEVGNVGPVMDGELDGFIKAYLMMKE